MTALSKPKREFVNACASDFEFFSREVLAIVDKKGRLIPFLWNHPQHQVWEVVSGGRKRVGILKARQEGISTWIAAYFFWKVLFNTHERAVVIAHETDAAASIFGIYKNFYECLPDWMQKHYPTKHSTKTELVFKKHTGFIRIATANSPNKLRGKTVQYLHCSEMAFWDKADEVFTAAMQSLTDRGSAFIETTANSFNHFYPWWMSENGYKKVFLPWMALKSYVLYRDDKGNYADYEHEPIAFDAEIVSIIERPLEPEEQKFVKDNALSPEQVRWMKWCINQKCGDDWKQFSQEYPATPQQAFLHSGDMYFTGEWIPEEVTRSTEVIEKPKAGHVYILGCDAASGSTNGDFSAACVLDVTNKDHIKPVAWLYQRIPVHQFATSVLQLGRKYHDALIVCEVNHVGAAVQEELTMDQYPRLYRRFIYDKMASKYVEKLGFYTAKNNRAILLNRLRKYISKDMMEDLHQVLINEIGSFTYNDRGEPYASPGCHDDMIFATALALEGLEQIGTVREEVMRSFKPERPEEIVAFEKETGLDAMTMMPIADAVTMRRNDKIEFDSFYGDGLE
jgi:hypothetical protein